jgi:hypothetical protein
VDGRSAVDFIVMLANLLVVCCGVLVGQVEFTAPDVTLRTQAMRAWWQFADISPRFPAICVLCWQ